MFVYFIVFLCTIFNAMTSPVAKVMDREAEDQAVNQIKENGIKDGHYAETPRDIDAGRPAIAPGSSKKEEEPKRESVRDKVEGDLKESLPNIRHSGKKDYVERIENDQVLGENSLEKFEKDAASPPVIHQPAP